MYISNLLRTTRFWKTLPEHLSSPPDFSGVRVYSVFSFICMFCRFLLVLLCFFFWPLCCLFFFDIRFLIAPLVFSKSSSTPKVKR